MATPKSDGNQARARLMLLLLLAPALLWLVIRRYRRKVAT